MREFTCSLDKSHPVVEKNLTFIQDKKLWTIPVLVCVDEKCMKRRGGRMLYHKASKGLRAQYAD